MDRVNLGKFPNLPGVYLMKNNDIVYIGKAKDLKKRLNSYFYSSSEKISSLLSSITEIDFIITENEYEALLLENHLIKKHQPKFNIKLKDSKNYPIIKLSKEQYPRLIISRNIAKNDLFLGPFINSNNLKNTLDFLNKLFLIRKCKNLKNKPCLYYYTKNCLAPCIMNIGYEYSNEIKKIKYFLNGKYLGIINSLKRKMKIYSKNTDFENALKVKEQIKSIQNISSDFLYQLENNSGNNDYIAYYFNQDLIYFSVIEMKDGKINNCKNYLEQPPSIDSDESLNSCIEKFLIQRYENISDNNFKIYIKKIPDLALKYFKENNIVITNKFLQNDKIIIDIAELNAKKALLKDTKDDVLSYLQNSLNLKVLPIRVEAFDISHFGGKFSVCGMVSFYMGQKDKKNYRLFNVNDGIDDYLALQNAIYRRYKRILDEQKTMPNLIIIDGGLGQLHVCMQTLSQLNLLDKVDIISLAKKNEEVYLQNGKKIILEKDRVELQLLQRIRDETHRFSITNNKNKRIKNVGFSLLKSIDGIGDAKAKKLISTYSSIENILIADLKDIKNLINIKEDDIKNLKQIISIYT